MERTKMKTTVYAKRLRERRAELQKRREAVIKAWPEEVKRWRTELLKWLGKNAVHGVATITDAELRNGFKKYGEDIPERVLGGSPPPPKYPDDKIIRKIDHELKALALVGKPETYVDDDDVKTFFTDEPFGV